MSWLDLLRPRAQPRSADADSPAVAPGSAEDDADLPDMTSAEPEPSLAETARLVHERDVSSGFGGSREADPVAADEMPSLHRGRGAGNRRLINVIGIVVILVVGTAFLVSANRSPAPPKAARPADAIANAMPLLVMPPPPGPAGWPGTSASSSGSKGAATTSANGAAQAATGGNATYGAGTAKPIALAGAAGRPGLKEDKPVLDWWERKRLGQGVSQAGGTTAAVTADARATGLERAQAAATLPGSSGETPALAGPAGTASLGAPVARDGNGSAGASGGRDNLAARLEPSELRSAMASVLADRNFLITKGTALDCALETAIDTTLPGILTCRLSRDVYSDNGQVLLLERGTQLVGEQAGSVKQGQARVFALWSRAKTPNGVVIALNSPGTDALGRSGLDGWVDNHFIERFGAAILMSIIQGAVNRYATTGGEGGTTVYSGTAGGGGQIVEKILESTVNIPPTILKNQGDHIQVMVARDLDFSSVYALRVAP